MSMFTLSAATGVAGPNLGETSLGKQAPAHFSLAHFFAPLQSMVTWLAGGPLPKTQANELFDTRFDQRFDQRFNQHVNLDRVPVLIQTQARPRATLASHPVESKNIATHAYSAGTRALNRPQARHFSPVLTPVLSRLSNNAFGKIASKTLRPPLRVMRLLEANQPSFNVGRMVMSGRMADVCAELDRLVALEEATRRVLH